MINRIDIEKKALAIRQEYNIQTYGIKDIFSLIEQMGIDLIRYPFGKDVLCGLSSVFEGKKVIVSNSSEILSREIFTIAHELGHLIYDFEAYDQDVKIDLDISKVDNDIAERRAHYFAACFLMPKAKIKEYVEYELQKDFSKLKGLDVVRIQVEFNTSYNATVTRLRELDLITEAHKTNLYNERSIYSSAMLFKMINADERLLKSTEEIKVPTKFLEFAISNYNDGYVPFSSLDKALSLVGLDAHIFLKKEISKYEDDISLDNLFEEFEE